MDHEQPPYKPIYSLDLVELERLKAYIENNFANDFIKLFKSSSRTFMLFNKKPHKSLQLYVDYPDLNNLTIKNMYFLPLSKNY